MKLLLLSSLSPYWPREAGLLESQGTTLACVGNPQPTQHQQLPELSAVWAVSPQCSGAVGTRGGLSVARLGGSKNPLSFAVEPTVGPPCE